jgi:hypothetical protein
MWLERHEHRRVTWNSIEYFEVQDGQARRAATGASAPWRLTDKVPSTRFPADLYRASNKKLARAAKPLAVRRIPAVFGQIAPPVVPSFD